FVEWVVHRKGVLEDSLHFFAEFDLLATRALVQVLAFVQNNPAGRRKKAENHHAQRCLAAAALTGNRNDARRGLINRKRNIVERDRAPLELLRDVLEFEQLAHCCVTPFPYKWHAPRWSGACSNNFGICTLHISITLGQRSWNTQPGGRSRKSGVMPGMPRKTPLLPKTGRLSINIWVYGCIGLVKVS